MQIVHAKIPLITKALIFDWKLDTSFLNVLDTSFVDVSLFRISKIDTSQIKHADNKRAYTLHTGCFKANVYTLTNDCDKYSMCSEKIMVDLLLVYPEISFDNNKS